MQKLAKKTGLGCCLQNIKVSSQKTRQVILECHIFLRNESLFQTTIAEKMKLFSSVRNKALGMGNVQ